MTYSLELTLASLLLLGIAFAHSILGEKYILRRLFRHELPKLFGNDAFTKQTLRFAWHLTSVAWIACAIVLLASPSRATVRIVGGAYFISALFPLFATRGKHLSWIVFLAIAGLCFFALR